MHLYTSDERYACFQLYGTCRRVRSAPKATKYKMKKKNCPQWESSPQPCDLKTDALPTALTGLAESCAISITFIHTYTSDTNVYNGKLSRMMTSSVFCLVNVMFCATYLNTSILHE